MLSEKVKNRILYFFGVFYIIIGVSAIINTIYQNGHGIGLAPVLWLCYICVLLIGIGVLKKDGVLLTSQLNILAIPLIIWSLDFFYILFTGNTLLGVADYFFIPGPLIGKIITSQHLFTLPIGIFLLYLLKIKENKAWLISFLQVVLIFFITRIVSSAEENINCVFSSCMNIDFGAYYLFFWFLGFFALIFLTNLILINLPFLREKGMQFKQS